MTVHQYFYQTREFNLRCPSVCAGCLLQRWRPCSYFYGLISSLRRAHSLPATFRFLTPPYSCSCSCARYPIVLPVLALLLVCSRDCPVCYEFSSSTLLYASFTTTRTLIPFPLWVSPFVQYPACNTCWWIVGISAPVLDPPLLTSSGRDFDADNFATLTVRMLNTGISSRDVKAQLRW